MIATAAAATSTIIETAAAGRSHIVFPSNFISSASAKNAYRYLYICFVFYTRRLQPANKNQFNCSSKHTLKTAYAMHHENIALTVPPFFVTSHDDNDDDDACALLYIKKKCIYKFSLGATHHCTAIALLTNRVPLLYGIVEWWRWLAQPPTNETSFASPADFRRNQSQQHSAVAFRCSLLSVVAVEARVRRIQQLSLLPKLNRRVKKNSC